MPVKKSMERIECHHEYTFTKTKIDQYDFLRYFVKDADYTDDIVYLPNSPLQEEYQLQSLEQDVREFNFYWKANETELACFQKKLPSLIITWKALNLINQVHISWEQDLINGKLYQHTPNESA